MPHTDEDEVDDLLEGFIVEADLAGRWLERNYMPPRLMFWRQNLDFSRASLAKLAPIVAQVLAESSPDALEEVSRRAAQYLGETIQAHARSFWQRTDGRFELRIERATGVVDVLPIAEPIARLLLAVRNGDPKAAELLGQVFDDAVRDGNPPVGR